MPDKLRALQFTTLNSDKSWSVTGKGTYFVPQGEKECKLQGKFWPTSGLLCLTKLKVDSCPPTPTQSTAKKSAKKSKGSTSNTTSKKDGGGGGGSTLAEQKSTPITRVPTSSRLTPHRLQALEERQVSLNAKLLNKRVKIHWPDEGNWYKAKCITSFIDQELVCIPCDVE